MSRFYHSGLRSKFSCPEERITHFRRVLLSRSVVSSASPWTAVRQASPSLTTSRNLAEFVPSSRRCHPAVSSSAALFSFGLQFPQQFRRGPSQCLSLSLVYFPSSTFHEGHLRSLAIHSPTLLSPNTLTPNTASTTSQGTENKCWINPPGPALQPRQSVHQTQSGGSRATPACVKANSHFHL